MSKHLTPEELAAIRQRAQDDTDAWLAPDVLCLLDHIAALSRVLRELTAGGKAGMED